MSRHTIAALLLLAAPAAFAQASGTAATASKPTTATSSGTRRPSSTSPCWTPVARKLLAAKSAVGRGAWSMMATVPSSPQPAHSAGIVTQEAPIHVSNVMVVDSDGKPTRVGYRTNDEGKRVRISRRNGKDI